MKVRTPEISWYARKPVLSLDFQRNEGTVENGCRLATAGFPDDDKYIRLWRVKFESRQCASDVKIAYLCGLGYHETSVNVVKFSPCDSYLAAGDSDGMVVVWKFQETLVNPPDIVIDDGEEDKPMEKWIPWKRFRDHLPRKDVLDVAWSPDGSKLLSCGMDHCLLIWDVEKGTKLRLIKEHESRDPMGVAWDTKSELFVSLSNSRALNFYFALNCQRLFSLTKAVVPSIVDPQKKMSSKLFHDDNLLAFARRLCFSPCGELLFVPAGVIEEGSTALNATYIFTRHDMKQPAVVLTSKKEIPFSVRCCPVVFELHKEGPQSAFDLPYRVIFAVLTKASVVFYDTQYCQPICVVNGFQVGHALDLAWTSDGACLVVTAEEGYCTFIRFDDQELGVPMKNIPTPAVDVPAPEPTPPSPPQPVTQSPKINTLSKWIVHSK